MLKSSQLYLILFATIIVKINSDRYAPEHPFDDITGDFSTQLVFINRSEWQVSSMASSYDELDISPVPYVMIYQTGTERCFYRKACVKALKDIQANYVTNFWNSDTGFNFIISSDGNVYVDRGWNTSGSHTILMNRISIGIALIGTFDDDKSPSTRQIYSLKNLVNFGVRNNYISKTFLYFSRPDMEIFFGTQTKITNLQKIIDSLT